MVAHQMAMMVPALCLALLSRLGSTSAARAAPPAAPWWQHGGTTPSPLLVPADLAQRASPIWAAALPPAPPPPPGTCSFQPGLDCMNDDLRKVELNRTSDHGSHHSQEACCTLCHEDTGCKVAVLVPAWKAGVDLCELKSACSQPSGTTGRIMCCMAGHAESCKADAPMSAQPQFAMARAEFNVSSKALKSAVAFVTGQQSPFAQPDARLATTDLDGDYGASIPHGGSSQARLLGAYKLHINGIVVGTGPGRRVNQTQGVDAIGAENARPF
jgi:hypothetical protein